MITRKTPLKRTELKPGKPLQRRTPLAPVSRKRLLDNRVRTTVVNLMRGSTPWCARCLRVDVPVHGHERLGRSQGGSIIAPDCLLCNDCNGWCEDNPQVAAFTGWKVSAKWRHSPALQIGQAVDLYGNTVQFATAEDEVAS